MKGYMFRAIIKKYWKLLLSILLVSAVGCAGMTGLTSGYLSLERSLTHYVRDYGYPDGVIQTSVTKRDKADLLGSLPGISEVNTRLTIDTVMMSPSGRYLSVRAFSFSDEDFQRFHYWKKTDPEVKDAILLEYNFADYNGISAGDIVSIRVGDEYRKLMVAGIVSTPETLAVQPSQSAWGENPDFGYIYFPIRLLEQEANPEYTNSKEELEAKAKELEEMKGNTREGFEKDQYEKAKNELDAKLEELAKMKASAKGRLEELDAAQKELDAAQKELEKKQQELDSNRKRILEQKTGLEQAEAALQEKQTELDTGIAEAEAQQAQLDDAAEQIAAGEKTLDAAYALLETKQAELKDAKEELSSKRQEAESQLELLKKVQELLNRVSRIISEDTDYNILYQRLQEVIQEALRDHQLDFDEVKAVLEELELYPDPETLDEMKEKAQQILEEQKERVLLKIAAAQKRVTELTGQLKDGLAQADAAMAELKKAQKQITQGYTEAKGKAAELAAARKKYTAAQSRLESAWQEIESGKQQLAEGYAQTAKLRKQLDSHLNQLDSYQDEIDYTAKELEKMRKELGKALSEGTKQIETGQKELDRKSEEIAVTWQEALTKFFGQKDELEAAYNELEELEEWEGYQVFCNQFLLRFTPGADREETLKEAIRILKDEGPEIQDSFLYENSVVKDRVDGNLMPVNTLTVLMPTVFFVIVLIVVFLFMSLVIRQSRREIGILRALGFSTGDVRLLFCKVNLLVSLGAIIPGTLIGIGIARYIGTTFESFFPLPVYEYAFDTGNAVFSALLTVVVGQAATLFGTSVISRIQPSEAMSRQIPSTGKLSGFGRWLTRKAGPFTKYSIISLLRNKKRLVFSVICLSASVMVIFASLSFIASKNAILTELFDKQIHYDCQVFLKDVPDKAFMEELEALDYVSETLQIGYYTLDISFQGHTETASVNAVPGDTDMIRIFGIKNEPLSIPSEGILLEKHLAAELGVVPGDLVLVDGIELEVAGISDQNENRTQYISTRQAEKLGKPTLRAILIRTEETDETAIEKGERSVQALLADRDDYLYCIFTRLFRDGMEKLFAVYDLAAWIIIGFAVLIGLIIVVNTTQTNLLEQSKELCVLRTLGFSHRTVSRKLFLQSLLYFVFSCIIGTPFGVAIAKAALRQLETKGQEYPFASGIAECLLTAGLVFGYILLSHLISSRSMKKWSIVEIVKEKE